ncbi:MAG: sulfur oxidation c-type cytochrome SoxA [Gammaproteobacteria bacterium]|nr:sulfur oxidation c-type cytochrome SoxA [Gammaproteobacteria bacterium]MBQ0839476.1 sulfur oxidation c-type cytochrome SoxA [Gammaproteobacteria bacterium]
MLLGLFVFSCMASADAGAESGVDFKAMVQQDIRDFQAYFKKRFSSVEFSEYKNGVYAIDTASREQWLEMEDFPPYEFAVDEGEELFTAPFTNGKTYTDCFANGGEGVRQNYPNFDSKKGEVITLELAINNCRQANGEKPLAYKKGPLAALSAYMASTSAGKTFAVAVPNEAAFQAYKDGKKFFYAKRGQLNFSCADCHMRVAGQKLRADITSPALGHPTGFPVYRSKWEEMGTLHRRYAGCNKNIRAKPLPAQGRAYRNLEYFQSVMSNGLEINGPSSRK